VLKTQTPALELSAAVAKKMLRPRLESSHKGQNGRVLIVGGSWKYYGSAALVAKAALRAGADLAYLLVPDAIAPTIASYLPDFIVWGYESRRGLLNANALPLFHELSKMTDAMVIGNGMTKDAEALAVAAKMAGEWKKPIVIDADCIGAVRRADALYTPHVVEFARLAGVAPDGGNLKRRAEQVRAAAEKAHGTILLKGNVADIASDGKLVAFNRTGNEGMTCGGTGDTLAGIAGALLAQGHSNFEAACLSAYLNGAAGDIAYEEFGYSLIASDLVEKIPAALGQLNKK
jgi:NAD(P)H-hydrate epimerase